MTKVTLDMNTFKALASDTRLDILKALDGKRMSLKDICTKTKLNKATLHEHLVKLNEAGLVKKKEREGHKWVYYKLTWKGECLLHPENTRIVVMFSVTFVSLLIGVMLITSFLHPITIGYAETIGDTTYLYGAEDEGIPLFTRSYNYNLITQYQQSISENINDVIKSMNESDEIMIYTVDDLTIELQNNVGFKNAMGQEYNPTDIQWQSRGVTISPAQCEAANFLWYAGDLNYSDIIGDNASVDNETNYTTSEGYENGLSLGYSPTIPELTAVVYDPSLLYLAIACITIFGVLFTVSTWRLLKNKKPKL